ncbi:hypothetical protein IGI04_005244, partial [Brassica rapa subsp. trilocularis]
VCPQLLEYFRYVRSRLLLFNDCGESGGRAAQLLYVKSVLPYTCTMFHSYSLSLLMICIFLNKTVFDSLLKSQLIILVSLKIAGCLHETDLDAATKGNRYIHSCLSLDVYISNAFTFVILNKFFCGTISRLNEEIKGFVKSGFLVVSLI